MAVEEPEQPVDLTNCDREAIHLIGSIQPHGVLLAADPESRLITHASQNSASLLGKDAQQLLGSSLNPFLTDEALLFLKDSSGEPGATSYHYALSVDGADLNASLYRSHSHGIVELESAANKKAVDPLQTSSVARRWIEVLETCNDWRDVVQSTAHEIRRLTGYDRVMVYRFAEDNHGWVTGESKRDDWEPYLDLHYPATDIPQPARRLLLLHPLRQICNVRASEVPILGRDGPGADAELDLTHSSLRQPSSIHLEYLENMKVRASFTASIIIQGKLWGLIACHHSAPFQLSRRLQADVFTVTQLVARRLDVLKARAALQHQTQRSLLESRMWNADQAGEEAKEGLDGLVAGLVQRFVEEALSLTGCDGIGFCLGETLHLLGRTPKQETVRALLHAVPQQGQETTRFSDRLALEFPGIGLRPDDPAGALVHIQLNGELRAVFWFRQEAVQTVNWAGNPSKTREAIRTGNQPISPRKSFKAWKEIQRGISQPWKPLEIESARAIGSAIFARWDHFMRLHAESALREKVHALKIVERELRLREQELEKAAAHLEERVRERTRQVRDLSTELTLAEQRERDRIAQILHDDIQQLLVSMQMRLNRFAERETVPPGAIQNLLKDLTRTMEISRDLTTDLSPPVLSGRSFIDALHWLHSFMDVRYQLNVRVEFEEGLPPLPKQLQVMLFQIVRELLFNVVKHAQTSEAIVSMRQTNGILSICVEDHGKGFRVSETAPASKGSYGTSQIRKQLALLDGSLTIDSAPGKGSRATVQIPLPDPEPET